MSRLTQLVLLSYLLSSVLLVSASRPHVMSDGAGLAERTIKEQGLPLDPTYSGYLEVNEQAASEMFYIFFEAEEPLKPIEEVPIILWLQGGPGCSSLFGMLYINGPYLLHPNMTLYKNPGSWNKHYAMLFIDQPVGTGFSHPGNGHIPSHEDTLAADLYATLQAFFKHHSKFQHRPFFITGESYAGKYVPSISHYILQAKMQAEGREVEMHKRRDIGRVEAPVFNFMGMAIGNGWTDAVEQTKVQASVSWSMGLIDWQQKVQAEHIQEQIIESIRGGDLAAARKLSDGLLAFIANASATATMEDVRRNRAYDADDLVAKYLNLEHIKRKIRAHPHINYESCSKEVDSVMGHDVMRSVSHLVPDILQHYDALIYLGQFDAECGVAGNDAWLQKLKWKGHAGFASAQREVWRREGEPAGFRKSYDSLTQVVIRNAGHMVPHDQPLVAVDMIEGWVDGVVDKRKRSKTAAAASNGAQVLDARVTAQKAVAAS